MSVLGLMLMAEVKVRSVYPCNRFKIESHDCQRKGDISSANFGAQLKQ